MGMEICCLYAVSALLCERTGWAHIPLLIIFLCYPSLFLLRCGPAESSGHGHLGRILLLIGSAVGIGAATFFFLDIRSIGDPGFIQADYPRLLFHAGLWAVLCLLGISPIPHMIEHHSIHVRFQISALVMLVFILMGADTLVPIVLYMVFVAAGLAQARWNDSIASGNGMIQQVERRYRLIGPLMILIPGTILLFALSPDLARAMLRNLVGSGVALLRWLDGHITPGTARQPIDILLFSRCTMRAPKEESVSSNMEHLPHGTGMQGDEVLLWASVIVTLILAAAFIYFTVKGYRRKRRSDSQPGIHFESTVVKIRLRSRIPAILANFNKIFGLLLSAMRNLKPIRWLRRSPQQEAISTARELYRALLRWAARHGLPRLPSQTPLEYLRSLCSTYPQKDRELILITQIYIQERYGRRPPDRMQFEEAVKAWQRIASGR